MTEGGLKVGHVVSVSGSKIAGILLAGNGAGDAKERRRLNRAVQIGALVKLPTAGSVVFGVVSALRAHDPASLEAGRIIEIDLFGESDTAGKASGSLRFQRGVSVYPGLGDPIHATTHEELAQIYACPSDPAVRFGTLHQDSALPAHVLIDPLLSKHFAILGTTGSGKSCALAVVLRSILAASPCGHIVLLDPHDEYGRVFGEAAERLSPATLELPYWLLNFEELVEVLCSGEPAARQAEVGILKECVVAAKLKFMGEPNGAGHPTVDTPVPYRLSTLIQLIDESMGKLEKPEQSTPYRRLEARIEELRSDRRFAFMFAGVSVRDTMPELLSHVLRIPVVGKPVTIFDLSGVPAEIVDVVVSVLCRMIFDFGLWSARGKGVPLLLVCEEAHRYVPNDPAAGFGPTRKAISRIAKEGRKYGVSLCLVSQRPSELSEAILSQCNTLFVMRMSNEADQDYVRRAVPENATGMLSALPALRTQEALVIGEGVTLPMRVRLDEMDEAHRPHSEAAPFSQAWQREVAPREIILGTVERWRRQSA